MMAVGLELVTVTEPIPPDFSTGVTRQPHRKSAMVEVIRRAITGNFIKGGFMGKMLMCGVIAGGCNHINSETERLLSVIVVELE